MRYNVFTPTNRRSVMEIFMVILVVVVIVGVMRGVLR